MSRYRIAMVSEHASPLAVLGGTDAGGQNVYVAHTARLLARAGHRVDVFTRRDAPDLPEVVTPEPGVRVIHLDAGPPAELPKEQLLPHMSDFGAALAWWSDRVRYDVVHAHFFMSAMAARRVCDRHRLPFVVTFHALGRVRRLHQGDADGFPPERSAIEDEVVLAADRIIAECPQDREDLLTLYGADPGRLETIPCGVDADEMRPIPPEAARERLGLDTRELVLLQLGRMVPRKGVDTVVESLGQLRRRHGVAARLLVVGGATDEPDEARTPEIGRLRRIAADAGVADAVVFTGRRDRDLLPLYYGAADVFITTPWYEPFGITPLEAMACGTPVIGSEVGGIKFSVRDGETGYLVPPRDPAAVADRVAYLARHPELRARLGSEGRRRAVRHFTWKRVAEQLERVYASLVEDRARAATRARRPARVPAAFVDLRSSRLHPAALGAGARRRAASPRNLLRSARRLS